MRQGLWNAVSEVRGARLAVLACAGKTFVAGGDMSEFDGPPVEPHLPDVVDAIERSTTPFIAALHGTVLGGGLELALACAERIAAPNTRMGLPEVNVGIIPGAGGSQRAPRLFGWAAAFDMACLGKLLSAERAFDLGAIDVIAEDPVATALARDTPVGTPISQRPAPSLAPQWIENAKADPAHVMKLVEVVRLPQTSNETLSTCFDVAKRLKKIPVLAGVCDGFIGNRILMATRRVSEYLLADGDSPGQIDAAMRAYGLPMGPFEMQDMAGLQIAEANRRRLDASRPASERYIDVPDTLCALGRFGQQSGKGWYRYEARRLRSFWRRTAKTMVWFQGSSQKPKFTTEFLLSWRTKAPRLSRTASPKAKRPSIWSNCIDTGFRDGAADPCFAPRP